MTGEVRRMFCMQVDPVATPLQSGRMVNRHCHLPAGHDGWHESVDRDDQPLHQWLWEQEPGGRVVTSQSTLFDQGA